MVLLLLTPAFCVPAGLNVESFALATMLDGGIQIPAIGYQLYSWFCFQSTSGMCHAQA